MKEQAVLGKLEILVTLECPWKCRFCCRGIDLGIPSDSHVTTEQISRLIAYLERENLYFKALKVDGGEPFCNPEWAEICSMLAAQLGKRFGVMRLYTAYPPRSAFLQEAMRKLPRAIRVWSMPQDAKHHKDYHTPLLISPDELGLLPSNKQPLFGSWATSVMCLMQYRCGRCFSRWGFTASAFEATFGRMLGFQVFSREFKLWGNPAVCRHCIFSIGRNARCTAIHKAARGELPEQSEVFQLQYLKDRNKLTSSLPPW